MCVNNERGLYTIQLDSADLDGEFLRIPAQDCPSGAEFSPPEPPQGQNLALRTAPQGQNLRNYQKSSGLPLGAEFSPPEGRIPGLGLNFLFYSPIFPSSTWRLGG